MKTIETNNQALLEVLTENGVEIICNEKMQMVITDGADRISEIVAKYAPAAKNDYHISEVGYMIDYVDGSGSGCDTIFDTYEDAERHYNLYTDKEHEGLEIVPVEVGYLVYVDGWDKGRRYVWDAAEIEDGGLCDCPNGYDDLIDTKADAEQLKEEVEDYIEAHDYTLTVGIEKVVKS